VTLMWQAALVAAQCKRPGGWCGHKGSYYMNFDCDGDKKADPICRDQAGSFGLISSKAGCKSIWNKGICQLYRNAAKNKALSCKRPVGKHGKWCSHKGARYYNKMDCDGDFVPDLYCADKNGKKWQILSGFVCKELGPNAPKCKPPRARAITFDNLFCSNRGGYGHSNKFSTNVGPYNLPACIAYVHGQSGCSGSFSYGVGDGWCDCVKKNVGNYQPRNCVPAFANSKSFYVAFTLEGKSVTSPLNLIAENYLCANRGGFGGRNGMSKNVGVRNLKACAAYVKGNKKCGPFFNYGWKDGWCDCVQLGKGQCKFFTDKGTQQNKNAVYSQFSKSVYIGASNGNKRCVSYTDMECPSNAGNKGIKLNSDYRHANDRFKITTTSSKVCAKRVDSGGGWGQRLTIGCAFKNIPKYQATAMTTAPGHLCENRGSNGGKDKRYSKKIGPKKYVDCLKWVKTTETCGHHFSYSWEHGWCDCVPKGQEFCKFYTDKPHLPAKYSAYEIYTTTTTTTTPKPTPKPTPPPKVRGLKSGMGWKVTKGFPACSVDISQGLPCIVSRNFPKKYSREESCEIGLAKSTKRLELDMKAEKYFDFLTIDGKQYHGTMKSKVDVKSKKLTWSADFWEGGSWKVCKTRPKKMKLDNKKGKK